MPARELTGKQRRRLADLSREESAKPMRWFRHDSDAHDDPAVAELLVGDDGFEVYGFYWVLVELLAARDRHYYDVGTDRGWAVLARDLGLDWRRPEGVERAKELAGTLADAGLLSGPDWAEGRVSSERMFRECEHKGSVIARRRLGGEMTAQKRWGQGPAEG